MSRSTCAFALLATVAALAIAGCGSSGSNGNSNSGGGGSSGSSSASGSSGGAYAAPATSGPGPETSKAAFVSLSTVPKTGLVLVNSEGLTLYDFHKDKGTTSACYGECAKVWPPLLTTGAPQPSNGASQALLGTTKRKDGTTQVTYAGHPIYTYAADKKPGEANGNDFSSFGAQWYALFKNGEEAGD